MFKLVSFLAAALLAPPTSAQEPNAPDAPTFATISQWWDDSQPSPNAGDESQRIDNRCCEHEGDREWVLAVRLLDRSKAFLYPVYFNPSGRNDWIGLVLARPALKNAQRMPWPVGRRAQVLDLDHDGVSEVIAEGVGSGGGSSGGERAIVHLDGAVAIILHFASFEENEGEWGKQVASYYARAVEWKFADIDGDGVDDLIEDVTIEKGRKEKSPQVRHVQNRYLFKNGRFTRTTLQMSLRQLQQRLRANKAPDESYSVDGKRSIDSGMSLVKDGKYWSIRWIEHGEPERSMMFASEAEACVYFLNDFIRAYMPPGGYRSEQ